MNVGPKVLVVADDAGICGERDRGILEAHARGAVTHASVLANGPSAAAFVRSAPAGLSLGLHINLTELEPLEAASRGFFRGKMGFREVAAATPPELIRAEVRAQLRWFLEHVGRRPRYYDGHQHVHVLPGVAEIVADVMAAARVTTTRVPGLGGLEEGRIPSEFLRAVAQQAIWAREEALRPRGIEPHAEAFVGLALMGRNMSAERLSAILRPCEKRGIASVELMCHPGYRGTTVDEFNCSEDREHELEVLCQIFAAAEKKK